MEGINPQPVPQPREQLAISDPIFHSHNAVLISLEISRIYASQLQIALYFRAHPVHLYRGITSCLRPIL